MSETLPFGLQTPILKILSGGSRSKKTALGGYNCCKRDELK
jgi:hypothetical protein